MPAGRGVVEGGEIPYQPWAAAKKMENFANRQTADPLAKCFLPGVPRIMYMEFPFQIFQTRDHVAITFEWSQVHRLIYTNGRPSLHPGIDFWMGDSRGRWEGDTLVVNVTGHNDQTWFDMAGNFHSEAMRLVERYTLVDADTIRYEVTIEDPKVFTRPWKISMPLHRHKDMDRILEYQCQAEVEEANGAFERDPRLGILNLENLQFPAGRRNEQAPRLYPGPDSRYVRGPHVCFAAASGDFGAGGRRPGERKAEAGRSDSPDAGRQAGPDRFLQRGRGRRQLRPREARAQIS